MRVMNKAFIAIVLLFCIFLVYAYAGQGVQSLTLDQAMDMDRQGKHSEAVAAIKEIISKTPESEKAKAYLDLGLVYFKSGEYDDALANFEKSVEIKKDNPMSYYFSGMIYEKKALGTPNAEKARKMKTLALKAWKDYLGSVEVKNERPAAHRNVGISVKESVRRAQKHIEILEEGLRDE